MEMSTMVRLNTEPNAATKIDFFMISGEWERGWGLQRATLDTYKVASFFGRDQRTGGSVPKMASPARTGFCADSNDRAFCLA